MGAGLLSLLLDVGALTALAGWFILARRTWAASGEGISFARFLWYVLWPEGRVHFGFLVEHWSGGFDAPHMRRLRYALIAIGVGWTALTILRGQDG
ncbi:hypothetical protein [Falsiroseomonas oryziterrae]|uniref:hypothetical protein n=1 Tax=Falsiroseomonas oryziterrae TaxID=2911368 RepID=UPI001F1FF710|nr:hypothetical protein [Roseomonas sp. NPKOSM-4]